MLDRQPVQEEIRFKLVLHHFHAQLAVVPPLCLVLMADAILAMDTTSFKPVVQVLHQRLVDTVRLVKVRLLIRAVSPVALLVSIFYVHHHHHHLPLRLASLDQRH